MEITETVYVPNRERWRAWLERNHRKKTEVWLVYYKKHTGRPRVPYGDAVEEALCFGWIDGIVKRIDDERYAQRFTPRRARSNWSELNKRSVARLIAEGRMTEAGLAKVTFPLGESRGKRKPASKKRKAEMPEDVRRALSANKAARKNFDNLAPSCQRQYVGWITAAKKEATRARRLGEALRLLERNEKLGMK